MRKVNGKETSKDRLLKHNVAGRLRMLAVDMKNNKGSLRRKKKRSVERARKGRHRRERRRSDVEPRSIDAQTKTGTARHPLVAEGIPGGLRVHRVGSHRKSRGSKLQISKIR
jgi:hypothetical protein